MFFSASGSKTPVQETEEFNTPGLAAQICSQADENINAKHDDIGQDASAATTSYSQESNKKWPSRGFIIAEEKFPLSLKQELKSVVDITPGLKSRLLSALYEQMTEYGL